VRDVPPLDGLQLPPAVRVERDESFVRIHLEPRGGGVGTLDVRVNGVPVPASSGQVELHEAPLLPGQENVVTVVAANQDDSIRSRAARAIWVEKPGAARRPSSLYAIVGGVSRYDDRALSLRYASRDAVDVATVVRRAGGRLFGADRVHVKLLASGSDEPTTAAFEKAFAEVAASAQPEDVVLLFLAGHGVGGADGYAFLARDGPLTAARLAKWLNSVRATRRAIILDTCAAGAAASAFVSAE